MLVPLIALLLQAQAGPTPAQAPVAPQPSMSEVPAVPDVSLPDFPSTPDGSLPLTSEQIQEFQKLAEEFQRQFDGFQFTTTAAQGPWGDFPMFIPPQLIGLVLGSLGLILAMIIGYPIARALARRIDRNSVTPPAPALPPAEVLTRLERIEHAVETMAVEIERISEGQRYTTRLMSDHLRELGAGAGSAGGGGPSRNSK